MKECPDETSVLIRALAKQTRKVTRGVFLDL